MKSLHHIEQRIFEVDGVRAALSGPVSGHADYWTNKYSGDNKVTEFRTRFTQRYPGVTVVLYDGIGHNAHGSYLLKNLRATYEFGWVQEAVYLYDLLVHEQDEQIESLKKALGQPAEARDETPVEPDPFVILGVDSGCSDEEVTQAYRRKIARFHPDKLSGLDPAIIAFGNERAQMINDARVRIMQERAERAEDEAA
jgi:hypothetical protein